MDFGSVAHDLRTPLHAMLGHTQLLGIEELSEAARLRLAIIEGQIRRMSRLIDCMEQSDRPLHLTRVDLPTTIQAVIAELDVMLRERDVRVVFRARERLPPVAGDPDAIHRLLVNIMINAAESMPGGGRILISARAQPMETTSSSAVHIELADTGTGIPAELLERVFEQGFTTKNGGAKSGLGLAICREIVEKHGGRIDLSSKSGRGTTVRVSLPIGR